MNHLLTPAQVVAIVQNLDEQINQTAMQLFELNKKHNDLKALRASVLNSDQEHRKE